MIKILSRFCAVTDWRETSHLYSGWGGLCHTLEREIKDYIVFISEDDQVKVLYTGGTLQRSPSGDWRYDDDGNWAPGESIEAAFQKAVPWDTFCQKELPLLQEAGFKLMSDLR